MKTKNYVRLSIFSSKSIEITVLKDVYNFNGATYQRLNFVISIFLFYYFFLPPTLT